MRFQLYLDNSIPTLRTESAKKGTFLTGAQAPAPVYSSNYLFLSLFVVVACMLQC